MGFRYDESAGDGLATFCVGASVACRAPNAILCEGFEGSAPTTPFVVASIHGSLTIEAGRSFRGEQAGHLRTDSAVVGEVRASVIIERTLTSARQLNIRTFYYLAAGYPIARMRMLAIFHDTAPFGGQILSMNPSGKLFLESPLWQGGVEGGALPLDRWACLELEIVASANGANNGSIRAFVDSVEVLTATNLVTSSTPAPNVVEVGHSFTPAMIDIPTHESWIDELAIGTARIGCDR